MTETTVGPTMVIMQLDLSSFQEWAIRGVRRILKDNRIQKMPIDVDVVARTGHDDPPMFYVRLPVKYDQPLRSEQSVLALVHDIEVVSLASEELTREWQVRMRHLHEGWLPFEFAQSWFKPRHGTGAPRPGRMTRHPAQDGESLVSQGADMADSARDQELGPDAARKDTGSVQPPLVAAAPSHAKSIIAQPALLVDDSTDNRVLDTFDRLAGAAFCTAVLQRYCPSNLPLDSPLLYWLLVSESMARHNKPTQQIKSIEGAVSIPNKPLSHGTNKPGGGQWYTELDTFVATKLAAGVTRDLKRGMVANWAAWMPMLLQRAPKESMPAAEKSTWDKTWQRFCSRLLADFGMDEEERAIMAVFQRLFSEPPQNLFNSKTFDIAEWQDKYADPALCAMIKLGLAVHEVQDQEQEPDLQRRYGEWRIFLREHVLKRLPGRLKRETTPAHPHPLFEDLVLSLLNVAGWLGHADAKLLWVGDQIEDCGRREDERLKPHQLALCASLFGWIEGYHSVGCNDVELPELRQILSGQAMALALQSGLQARASRSGSSRLRSSAPMAPVFYLAPSGTHGAVTAPVLRITGFSWRAREITTQSSQVNGGASSASEANIALQLSVGDPPLAVTFPSVRSVQ